ncbi:MAG: hypothetical protein AABX07_05850 [Nanoarchaeota archaeon]
MEKKYKIIIALLIIALVFITIAIVVKIYFPEWKVIGNSNSGGGEPNGNIKIIVEKPLPADEGK